MSERAEYSRAESVPEADAPLVVPPKTKEDREYLIMMFKEHAEHARQHETLRAMATGFFMALIAGLLAFAVGEPLKQQKLWTAGILVFVISLLGAVLNYKHYERNRWHTTMRRAYSASLATSVTKEINEMRANYRARHAVLFRFTSEKLRLPILWIGVYLVTLVTGIIVVALGFILGA